MCGGWWVWRGEGVAGGGVAGSVEGYPGVKASESPTVSCYT